MNNLFIVTLLFTLFVSCQSEHDKPTSDTKNNSQIAKKNYLDSIPQNSSLSLENLKGNVRSIETTTMDFNRQGEPFPVDSPDIFKYDRNGNITYSKYPGRDNDFDIVTNYYYNQFNQCTHSIQICINIKKNERKYQIKEQYTYKNGLLIKTETSEYSYIYEKTIYEYDSIDRLAVEDREFLNNKERLGVHKGEHMKQIFSFHKDHEEIIEEWTGLDDEIKTITRNPQGDIVSQDSFTPLSKAGIKYKARCEYKYDDHGNWIESTLFTSMLMPDSLVLKKNSETDWKKGNSKKRIIKYY